MKKDIEWFLNEINKIYQEVVRGEKSFNEEALLFHIATIARDMDEPEKPVIPKFVADWLEEKNKNFSLYGALHIAVEDEGDIGLWITNRRQLTLARAWLDGYEVEKEPQWVVRYEDGYFSEEIKFGCGIDGDWVDEVSSAYHFTDKAKAEAVALLIGGTIEEVTK